MIINQTQSSKFVHKKTYSSSGRSNFLGEHLVGNIYNHRLLFSFLSNFARSKKEPGERSSLELNS